jgi:hypothetical protein
MFFTVLTVRAKVSNITPEGFKLNVSNDPVQIAKDGEAMIPIVISPQASEKINASAKELAGYLKKITGAEFEIKKSALAQGITLGTIEQYPVQDLKQDLTIRNHYDGIEAFAISSAENHICLLGNTDLGVSHAVYRFLELLGCRWFFMGPTWEIIPEINNLDFALNEISRPTMWERNIWFDRLSQGGEKGDPNAKIVYEEWAKHNRMNKSLKVKIYHAWHAIPKSFKKEFEEHQEYFALTDYRSLDKKVKRKGPQFCVTNPELQKIIIEYAKTYFEKNPDADMVSLDPADCSGWCICEECKKLGKPSNQPFYLANIVAKELAKSHPGKYVGLLAYSWYSDPPVFKLEPNVYVQLTRGMNSSGSSFDQLFKMWTEKCDAMSLYEYYSYWEMDKCMLPGTKVTDIRGTAKDMSHYAANGVKGISGQASCNWGIHGLGYYMANKLMWNPNADVEALRKDFLSKSFGPAAKNMGKFFDYFDKGNTPLPGKTLLSKAITELEQASSKVADDKKTMDRIDDLKKEVVFSYIGEKLDALKYSNIKNPEEKKKLAIEWFTWSYRIRNSYMVAWLSFRSCYGRPISIEFNDPNLFWRDSIKTPHLNPWRVDKPVTTKELDTRLAKIKQEIGDVPTTPEIKYSNEYVLVNTGLKVSNPRPRRILSSILATYLFASIKGEPIDVTVEQSPYSVKRPDAVYILSDFKGKELTKGHLPIGVHKLKLKVPTAGAYNFSCFSRGRGYVLTVPTTVPGAFTFERMRRYRPSGYMYPLYFYVPKGIKNILFYAYNAGIIVIRDSDGNVVHQKESDGSYISISVAAGQDGKVWQLGDSISGPGAGMRLRRFSFLNLPNVLNFNSDQVFVPKELAEKDELNVIIK